MHSFSEQCLDMARSILGHNLDSIQPDGTVLPAPGEEPRADDNAESIAKRARAEGLSNVSTVVGTDADTRLAPGSVDLVFADPPFNIGYEYDVYQDKKDAPSYLSWSREWMTAVHKALKPTGTFWLAIGDEYAAELKIIMQEHGLVCRSWVIWYYTFGVNCKQKFLLTCNRIIR